LNYFKVGRRLHRQNIVLDQLNINSKLSMNKKSFLKQWWHTDCKLCQKTRLFVLWVVIMLVIDALWFHLIFR